MSTREVKLEMTMSSIFEPRVVLINGMHGTDFLHELACTCSLGASKLGLIVDIEVTCNHYMGTIPFGFIDGCV